MTVSPDKPTGGKLYGHIFHLPGSRMGEGDRAVNEGQHRIACVKTPPDRKGDKIFVLEKLDGANCGVAKVNGEVIALNRAGYRAVTADYVHHRLWHDWVGWPENQARFARLLREGERVVGEWLVLAHGTRYCLPHEPFVPFDLITAEGRKDRQNRVKTGELFARLMAEQFTPPRLLHQGTPCGIETARGRADTPLSGGHGALDLVEGMVWRVERPDYVDFLAKWVRPEKVDGLYLFELDEDGRPRRVPGVNKHDEPCLKYMPLRQPHLTWNNWPGKDDPNGRYAAWRWAYH